MPALPDCALAVVATKVNDATANRAKALFIFLPPFPRANFSASIGYAAFRELARIARVIFQTKHIGRFDSITLARLPSTPTRQRWYLFPSRTRGVSFDHLIG